MKTQQLRQSIQVIGFHSHSDGCNIKYVIDGQVHSLCYNDIAMLNELTEIGSVDEDITPEEWADYNLSQWDALNLVIRNEYAKYMDEEISNSDIGKAIDKLKLNTNA